MSDHSGVGARPAALGEQAEWVWVCARVCKTRGPSAREARGPEPSRGRARERANARGLRVPVRASVPAGEPGLIQPSQEDFGLQRRRILMYLENIWWEREAPHVQYERLGADVTLPCGTASWDAAVTWRVNGTDLAPDLLNGSQLILRSLELGHSGLYACFHRDSWHLRHQVLLHVGLPPREPVLSCRSNTYPKGFYCSWHLPTPTYIPNTFNVTVLHGSKIMVCEKDPALKNRCHIRYMHLFSTIKYKVSISVSNALGHNTTAITFDEFTIVKPDPPENVVARPVPSNPRRLEVTWQTPSTWPDPESFPLKFFLRYRPLILDQWQHVELSDGTAHTITDAYAGKEYIIQVAAKDNEIGTWSDWSVAAHATPWTEEPRHLTTEAQAPETTTSTTSSLAPPPTTKICDPGELGSGGGHSIHFLTSVFVTLVLAAAAATANNLLI
ncbi:ciliary neurotrophic factor receptor subunit alpha isoform X1 [Arvicanthis niloticus]|uniref:ciliary neurotrophic factor receptor subunit alpha isoform X1 n=1 Tax=Arvicanthis niloticus TaxID=61156 RepID=UPI00402BDC2F